MQCPRCNAPIEQGATFCGNCGNQIAPLQQGVTVNATAVQSQPGVQNPNYVQTRYGPPDSVLQSPPQMPSSYSVTPETPNRGNILPPSPWRPDRRMILIIALIVVVIAAGTIGFLTLSKGGSTPAGAANGTVSFVDGQNSQGRTDSLSIIANGLPAPSSGSNYFAWIVNDQSEHITPLGQLA